MGTQTGLKLLGYFANICWRYLIFHYFIFTLGKSSMNGRRYDGGLWVVACFSGVILLLKYVRERRLVFLESTYLWMDLFCFLLFVLFFFGFWWLEYAQHDACVLLIILLISIINSNNKFFKMKNLILILISFVYFCVLKMNTLTVIQLSIKDNGNREKSFSARTV